jgi:hypothetical protein
VTPQVFKFIGPSNDSRRHGRGTYLFVMEQDYMVHTAILLVLRITIILLFQLSV